MEDNPTPFNGISGKFGSILIDPQWRFVNRTGKMAPEHKRLRRYPTMSFDEDAARQFDDLRGQHLRLGTMDLKIAATALVHNALLLSANRRDFERVPGLRAENWLD